ncbi:hypothetical protein Tco_1220963 [Tanacetum coccineum]
MTQAQQRTYMCNYIKNIGSHTLQQLKKLSFDEIKELFETTIKRVKDFVPMERSKRQKTNEEQPPEKEKELSEEELQKLMMIVPMEEIYVEALQKFDRDDMDKLWSLVKERFSSTDPPDDKERTLWVELKRLFEPDTDDILWKLQRYMHDPLTWRLYDTCGVHHVSTDKGHDIFMLEEKDYPLSKRVLMLMLVNKLLVEQSSKMANELLKKIFILANRPIQGGLLGIKGFYKFLLLVQLSTAKRRLSTAKLKLLPPKKQIHSPSSSLTTLSNSSRKQAYNLEPPSFSVYTPTPPQIFETGKSYIKEHLKHHEKQIEDILYYLEEFSFHRIEKMEERLVNGWIIIPRDFDEVKTKLKEARTQILELQKKHMGQRDKIAFVRFRISDLEMTLEDIQDRHQLYMKNLMGHTS